MPRLPPKRNSGITIDKKRNVLLVDGNALYKTGYHGAKNEYNEDGQHIGGIFQFMVMLRKFMNEELYHRVFVFWDGELSGKLRFDVYSDYKKARGKDYINGTKPVDDVDQILQRAIVQEYLEELYIRQLEHPIVESDDFIAYYCKVNKSIENITIVTNDRDLCQLINENIRIYLCDKKIYVDLNNYNTIFKHHQTNSMLIKLISGDESDSIKGIKGVKETTLLKFFPELASTRTTLEEIISKSGILQEQRIKEKKKPLKSLHNLINGITDGVQGNLMYEINRFLVDLSNPLLTEDAKEAIHDLMDNELSQDDRSIKNAYLLMKRDGIDKLIYNYTIEYLMPFKKLIERERKTYI